MDTEQTSIMLDAEALGVVNELSLAGFGGATASLVALLNQEVKISAPKVEATSVATLAEPFAGEAAVLLTIQQTQGFTHPIAYAIKETDAKKIAALMMGGTLDLITADPIDDLEQGAVIEAFSQMHAAANDSIGGLLQLSIEADSPELVPFSAEALNMGLQGDVGVSINFTVTLASGDALPMVQYLTSAGAQMMVAKLLGDDSFGSVPPVSQPASAPPQAKTTEASMSSMDTGVSASKAVDPVTVRPVDFASFDNQHQVFGEENKNLELVMDVTLSLTVELGRTNLSIKDVLELTRGSVIELDRVAGEPVDLLANGKLIAKGEVVVIEDNFGLRITSIVSPADRLRGM